MTATDPLLAALTDARQRKEQANNEIRLLLAYARCLVKPRPYRLADLAEATGLSISSIRTAYCEADIAHAAELLAAVNNWQHAQDAINTLLATSRQTANRDTATCSPDGHAQHTHGTSPETITGLRGRPARPPAYGKEP